MSVGSEIKQMRKARGLTQVELAEKSNISRSYLAGVEGDRYNPSIETLQRIADSLNTAPSVLLGERSILDLVCADNFKYLSSLGSEKAASVSESLLSPEDFNLLQAYHAAPEYKQDAIKDLLGIS